VDPGAGIATAGTAALGACARAGTSGVPVATGSAADLNDLARRIRGRFLRDGSPLFDEARKVWNLAYDRRPLAMVRCADVDDASEPLNLNRVGAERRDEAARLGQVNSGDPWSEEGEEESVPNHGDRL
jgi:hypothetical protein